MFTNDTNINLSLNSNEQLFKWTILFRQHINKIIYQNNNINKKDSNYIDTPSLQDISKQYIDKLLTKNVWGGCLWKLIHIIPLLAKVEEDGFCNDNTKKNVKAFITCIAILIPCSKCRKHAWQYYQTHSIDDFLDTNLHAFEWTVIFHNNVTERLNQDEGNIHPTYTPFQALSVYIKEFPSNVNFMKKFKTM
jgi:hypothetical protein